MERLLFILLIIFFVIFIVLRRQIVADIIQHTVNPDKLGNCDFETLVELVGGSQNRVLVEEGANIRDVVLAGELRGDSKDKLGEIEATMTVGLVDELPVLLDESPGQVTTVRIVSNVDNQGDLVADTDIRSQDLLEERLQLYSVRGRGQRGQKGPLDSAIAGVLQVVSPNIIEVLVITKLDNSVVDRDTVVREDRGVLAVVIKVTGMLAGASNTKIDGSVEDLDAQLGSQRAFLSSKFPAKRGVQGGDQVSVEGVELVRAFFRRVFVE